MSIDNLKNFTPQYNIAPTHKILAIASVENKWQCQFFRWGLIPRWSKKQINTNPLINARRETLSEKPSFQEAFAHRRCLILADGFYEWNCNLYQKHPLYFKLKTHSIFAFAGLWESWRSPNGEIINSTNIINTSADGVMKAIHPRMPVVLSSSAYETWLNANITSTSDLDILLKTHNRHDFSYYPVSEEVNFIQNNYPNLLEKERVIITEQLSLF